MKSQENETIYCLLISPDKNAEGIFVGPLVMLDKLHITFYIIYFFNTFDVIIIIIMKKRISMARRTVQ